MLDRLWRRAPEPPPPPGGTLLPADLLRRVRRIEISTRRLIDQGVAGDYHSVFRGRGMEFSEVRPYQPGDDVRDIDWNVTARMGQPYVKQFVEERDLTVFLALDVSGSLGFGSRAILKRELAAEVSALLAFAALANHDRVGAALMSDRLELYLRPARRRNQVLRLVRDVLGRPAHGGTDLDLGLRAALANLRQRAVVFLVSDFIAPLPSGAMKLAASRHDLVVVEVVDPRDLAMPASGPVLLEDAETGGLAVVSPRRAGRALAVRETARREALRRLTRQLGVDHLELRTDRPYLPALVSFFAARRRRLSR
ncbi:MAG: DUF58 domain-containing protein [Holophagales bacterium]|nr:MAG: DUF58 domain-containing protein [Holophagales bacterium]